MTKILFDKSIEKFIKSLEKRTKEKTVYLINLLEEAGIYLGMPHSKKIVDDIFELRVKSKQEVRILYTFKENKIYLLNGFIKDSNKIPKKEITKAIKKAKRLD